MNRPESIEEEYRRLLEENEKLKAELREKKTIINRAKDITPVVRPRVNRVFKILWQCGMGLSRIADGWILEAGELRRKLKRLSTVWELVTTEGLELKDIFINEPLKKVALVSLQESPQPVVNPDSSIEEKIKRIYTLIEKYEIALPPTVARSLKDFTEEQITKALDYYKATMARGKEIKSASGWLLACLKDEWYKNFVPEPAPYIPQYFTAAESALEVEAVPMPKDFWAKARSYIPNDSFMPENLARLEGLKNLIPF